jgi:endonuclease/exonuclease/phosphatase family metal-dependent hydrolase
MLLGHSMAGAQQPETDVLRVLSYNIHHGEGVDGKLDLRRIAEVIRSARPDVVALQEVDRRVERSGGVDQAAELAERTGMNVVFGGNISLQGGHYGNAILSRFPIRRHENRLLPNLNQGEQRGVIDAEIELPGWSSRLRFLATHLDHRRDPAERIASAKAINEWVADAPRQLTLLAGDLNAVVGSEPLKVLERRWSHTTDPPLPTIPVDRPQRQIDYILFRPAERWEVVDVRVLDEAVASDHRPILAVLRPRSDASR